MGSSIFSPSPPVSCTVLQRKSTTRLFTVPRFSEWARTPAGTALHFEFFRFRGMSWQLKVYPAGFSDEDGAGDFVAVFVRGDYASAASSTKISVEILDARGESAVFDGRTAGSEQTLLDAHDDDEGFGRDKGYVRFVERRELEESQCVRADGSFTVRCTVSSNREMTKSFAKAAAFSMSDSDSHRRSARPPLPEYCSWRRTKSTTRLFAVTEFSSRWARTPAGHALNFKPMTFRDSSWRLRLFPAGLEDDATGDSVAVFVSSGMWTHLKDTRMSIEILEQTGGRAALDGRTAESELTMVEHMSGGFWRCKEYMKGYVRFAGRKELEESFTIRCTLSTDEKVVKWLTGTSPPASCSRIAKEKRAKNTLY